MKRLAFIALGLLFFGQGCSDRLGQMQAQMSGNSSHRSWGPIAALSLGILYHQTGVLLCIPLAIYFWRQKNASCLRRYLELVGVSAAAVLCVYLMVWASRGNSAGGPLKTVRWTLPKPRELPTWWPRKQKRSGARHCGN